MLPLCAGQGKPCPGKAAASRRTPKRWRRLFVAVSNLPPRNMHFHFSSPPRSLIFYLDANFSSFSGARPSPLPLTARFLMLLVLGHRNRPLAANQTTIPAIDAGLVASAPASQHSAPWAPRPLFWPLLTPHSARIVIVPALWSHIHSPRLVRARLDPPAPPSGCGRSLQGHHRYGACEAFSLWRACHPSSGGQREPRCAGARGGA